MELSTARPLYTLQFGLLCASNFLFSASFQMLIPELPDHLTDLGGADYKGYIIALFTLIFQIIIQRKFIQIDQSENKILNKGI